MQLSAHFTLEELTHSQNAVRLGIANQPNTTELANLVRLAGVLEQVRSMLGCPVIISSGFRCKALNQKTPGASGTSAHSLGLAADIVVPGMPVSEVCARVKASGIIYDQLIHEGTWTHIGLSEGSPRRQELTAHFGPVQTVYTPGLPKQGAKP